MGRTERGGAPWAVYPAQTEGAGYGEVMARPALAVVAGGRRAGFHAVWLAGGPGRLAR